MQITYRLNEMPQLHVTVLITENSLQARLVCSMYITLMAKAHDVCTLTQLRSHFELNLTRNYGSAAV